MFFRKAKRIKELEKEIHELEIYKTRLILENHTLHSKKVETVTLGASLTSPFPLGDASANHELAYLLGRELAKSGLIEISKDREIVTNQWLIRGLIKVVRRS